MPSMSPSTHAVVRFGAGQAEAHRDFYSDTPRPMLALVSMARVAVRATPDLELSISAGEDYSDRGMYLSAPSLAVTWTTTRDRARFAVRGAGSVAIGQPINTVPGNLSSSLIAHDPLIASAE